MLNERRRRVLQALVEEYIASATPVGSKTLVERYELGCSPATVRNELSILEETGYVVQPHVSAGRMPTDTGYRDFVDRLLERVVSDQSAPAALPFASQVEDLMRETSILLTRLTNSLAVVMAPSISLARVRRIDLVSMAPGRVLFVLITESGQVLNRHVEVPADTGPERISEVEKSLNAALVGKRAADIVPVRHAMDGPQSADGLAEDSLMALMVDQILDVLAEADKARLHHVGIPALLAQPEFHDAERARPLIESLEDGIALLEALNDAMENPGVRVRIGHENERAEFGTLSIVATHYGDGSSDGVIGVIGPTRMDYQRAIAAVKAVSEGLSDALS